jgi:hypothetical protein
MQADYGFFGGPIDFNALLEQINSEEVMFVFEGLGSLISALNSGDEKQLNKFPYEPFLKRLVQILKGPILDDIGQINKRKSSSEIYYCLSELHYVNFDDHRHFPITCGIPRLA